MGDRFYRPTSEIEFNNLLVSGYYFGKLTQNTPDGTTDSNWIIEVQAFDNNPNYVYQRATRASNRLIFTRYRNGSAWSNWEMLALRSDLSDRAKKLFANFIPGNTVLDFSAWSTVTLLSIVTYKDEATALYLIRKESSNRIYCIPVKSSTQVSVTYNGENKLILTNSATYGGTYTVLFLS